MHKGVILALASALLFGASTPVAKLLLGAAPPQMVAGLLYLGAGLGLSLVVLTRRAMGRAQREAPLRRPDLPWLALVILSGGIAGPLLLLMGLQRTGAANASLMLNLEGLATMLIAWLVFRESTSSRIVAGALAILAGALVLAWQGSARLDPGALLIAAACLCWAVDNNVTRKLSSTDPIQITLIKGLVAGTVNLTLALILGADRPSGPVILGAGLAGFLGYGISLALFVLALRHIGTARTGAYFSLAPFAGALLAIVMLGEPATPQLLIAAVLIGIGLWLHLTEDHSHTHAHDEIEHEHAHVHDDHHQHEHGPDTPLGEPHSHRHSHEGLRHAHAHFPDLHHRHSH